MAESSLANWDGSLNPAKATSAPIQGPTSISPSQSIGSKTENSAEKNIDALSASKTAFSAQGSTSEYLQLIAHANPPYASPKPSSSMSISPSATIGPQMPHTSSPAPVPRASGQTPLHFGAPREILTTPVSPMGPGLPWLKRTPPEKGGLIPLDIQTTSSTHGRGTQVQRAQTYTTPTTFAPNQTHTRTHSHTSISSPLSSLSSALSSSPRSAPASAPATGPGTSRTSISALPSSSSSSVFGPPSALLSVPAPRSTSFGEPGPALRPLAPAPVPPTSTSALLWGTMPTPNQLPPPPPRHPLVSAATSPQWLRAPGSWRDNGRLYVYAQTEEQGQEAVQSPNTTHASPNSKSRPTVAAGANMSMPNTEGHGHRHQHQQHRQRHQRQAAGPGPGAMYHRQNGNPMTEKGKEKEKEKEGRARSVMVTYESKAKKARSEEARASEGISSNSTSTSTSTSIAGYKRGPAGIVGGSPRKQVDGADGDKPQLFIPSPEISKAQVQAARDLFTPPPPSSGPPAHELFTPPPERLFTATPERPASPVRRARVPDGVGVAHKLVRAPTQKRKREVLDYVRVPPMPYKRARTDSQRGRSPSVTTRGRKSRSMVSWSTRDGGASSEREWESSSLGRSRSRSVETRPRKTKVKAAPPVGMRSDLGDALNQAWAANERTGSIPVGAELGGTRGKRKERGRDEQDAGARKRVKKVEDGERGRKRSTTLLLLEDGPSNVRKASSAKIQEGAWTAENDGVTWLSFDVAVLDADRAACAGLKLALKWDGELPVDLGPPRRPCLAWPLPQRGQEEDEVSTGGSVRTVDEAAGGGRRRVPREDVSKGKTEADEVTRGRPAQRKSRPPKSKIPSAEREREQQEASPASRVVQNKPKSKRKPPARPGPLKLQARIPVPSSAPLPQAAASDQPPSSPLSAPTASARPSPIHEQLSFATSTSSIHLMLASPTSAEGGAPMALSAKARGKQRAASRTPSPGHDADETLSPWIVRSASRRGRSASRGHRSASRGRRSASRGRLRSSLEPSMRTYFEGFDPSPPGQQLSPHGLRGYPLAPLVMPPFTAFDVQANHTPLPFVEPAPSSYMPPQDSQPYGDGTVDPSLLLGGVMMELEADYYAPADEHTQKSPTLSVASSSSSLSSSEPAPSPVALRVSSRRPVHRQVPDGMMLTDLLGETPSPTGSSSYDQPLSPKPKPKPKPKTRPKSKSKSKSKPNPTQVRPEGGGTKVNECAPPSVPSTDGYFRYSGPPWPLGDGEAFCHQCRRTVRTMTMTYDECKHTFCVRCVMLKYDPGTVAFELSPSPDDCPRCSGICSCDTCTRRRGEVYAPLRPKAPPEPRPSGPLLPRTARASRVQPRDLSLERMVINPVKHFANMYDHNGVRIARTFTGEDGNDQVVVACHANSPRIFIGAVQDEWNLGPKHIATIEPTPVLPRRPREGARRRYYIGKEKPLHLPVRPRRAAPIPAALTAVVPAAPAPTPAPVTAPVPADLAIAVPAAPPSSAPLDDFNEPLSPLSSLGDTETGAEDDD
ncbi:hypothetical protein B0H17DRAFT_453140 [Mycena rosella]|uniref:RING-type domain-containing protein n=1 Tax=Mycena rosella TaxID=1033263 RepID=A0AAD7GYT1_MYCRO|nr:hypothetical protein B0H17DRAFT_453140 [Mycena rosella]